MLIPPSSLIGTPVPRLRKKIASQAPCHANHAICGGALSGVSEPWTAPAGQQAPAVPALTVLADFGLDPSPPP
jgi:hypothetical protein